jgi:hypothetical protein
MGNIATID